MNKEEVSLVPCSHLTRLVGLSRDISKPSAKAWIDQGVEMKQVDVVVGNEASVREVLDGSDIVFVRQLLFLRTEGLLLC